VVNRREMYASHALFLYHSYTVIPTLTALYFIFSISSLIRPELSEKNKYWIEKHRINGKCEKK
jgi:hypothetical protein